MSQKNKAPRSNQLSPEQYIRSRGRSLKITDCFIAPTWEKDKITSLIIVREHANGNKTVGMVLVDLLCLGVKDARFFFNLDDSDYKRLKSNWEASGLIPIDYNKAHNIVYGAVDFAEEFGIRQNEIWEKTVQYLFEADDERVPLIEIEFGANGKPFYFATPNEGVLFQKRILDTLSKTAGEGNFDYIITYNIAGYDATDGGAAEDLGLSDEAIERMGSEE